MMVPMTSNEIWQVAAERGYDKLLNSKGKTPWNTLGAQIHVNTKDNPRTPFESIGAGPKRFYLKKLKSSINLDKYLNTEKESDIESKLVTEDPKKNYLEKDLHSYLAYYAYYFLRAHTKTINHSKSGKKEFGEWVHPDIVGCYFPIDDWEKDVFELSTAIGNTSIKILSFELKRRISFGNLRESFFQAVSNSSWANEGYLVAAEISDDVDFRNELKRLSTSFGIGVIELDLSDPNSYKIIFPARFEEILDWETINKLTMNKDFKDFIQRVKNDINSREIRREKYDKVLEESDFNLKKA